MLGFSTRLKFQAFSGTPGSRRIWPLVSPVTSERREIPYLLRLTVLPIARTQYSR